MLKPFAWGFLIGFGYAVGAFFCSYLYTWLSSLVDLWLN